ncbi:MAG: hypothetical protein KatS3mg043_0721 [Rhodothermaceae bacterium]|nr:MAG: hypothetical protein KatS3mg043_0721 [Rhodothermaceae bacterium]
MGEWYRFFDLDGDGDLDLLAEQRFSYIRYFRNDGTPQRPAFVPAEDSLRDAAGRPIFSDRQNIPNLTDIDCNGRLDLFIGKLDGTVMRYEATHTDEGGIPRFALVTDRFEDIEIVAQLQGSLHGANTLALVDIDDDGDQDFFWGDFFEPGLLFIQNTGTCARPSLRGQPVPFPPNDPFSSSGYNAPAFADLDADGDLDLLVGVLGGAFNPIRTAAANLYFFENRGNGHFTLQTERFLYTLDAGSESIPAFADLDADGDLDLLLANKIAPGGFDSAEMYFFENTGTPQAPAFRQRGTLPLHTAYHYAPALGDLDGDGDLDLLVGTWTRGKVAFYRNDGTPQQPDFVLVSDEYLRLTRGSNATPALADLDADGDLDLLVGEFSGTINFYRNDGTPQQPDFVLVSDEYLGIDVGQRSFPVLHDLDGDGDLDLIIGSEAEGLVVYRNDGSPHAPAFVRDETPFPFEVPFLATPAFVDLDGDGDADFVSGGTGGGLIYYRRR